MQLPVRLLTTGMAVTIPCKVILPPPRCLSPVMRFTPGKAPLTGISRTTIRYGKVERRSLLGRDLSSNVDMATTSSVALAMSVSPGSRVREVVVEPAFTNLLGIMAASGAFLGPILDNYHSAFGVLTYKNPVVLSVAGHALVTTDWWVPPLFAVAGAGIGALYILFDAVLGTPGVKRAPEWKNVFLAISLFSFQYYLSGLLVANGCPYWLLVTCLAVLAERAFKLFDDTRAGLIVSLATAVLGPLIEVMLVNVLGLYVYNGADVFGVDSWIPVVYFCGGPAVGSLARAVHAQLRASNGAEY